MRSEVDHHFLLSPAKDEGVGEGGKPRANLDRASTSIIHDTVFEGPAVNVPCPTSDGTIDKSGPEEYENHHR